MNTQHQIFSKITLLGVAFQCFSLSGCAQKTTPAAGSTTQVATTPAPANPPAPVTTPTPASAPEAEKTLAFPGAEGFGKYTTGGRGGQVLVVSNLNDNGPGSLRAAIQKKGPRIIVFSVSGNIQLEAPLDINNGDVTIAGQSAPGDGICIQNYPVSVKGSNVIIRYMRFRLGDKAAVQADAISGNKGANNIIIDHCSMGWATDESASFYRNQNFTLQWSIISESLNSSVHAKGEHGYGGIWGGRGASFHHNLIANHNSRTPRFSGSSTTPNPADELVDFTNNVIYNWGQNNVYGGEKGRYNIVNNYYKAGAATTSSKKNRIVNPSAPFGKFFVAGNYVDGFPAVTTDNWAGGVQPDNKDSLNALKMAKAFAVTEVNVQEPKAVFESVLSHAGASLKRDAVDTRIVQEVRTGTSTQGKKKNGIIDSQQDVGGWPVLKSTAAPEDKDQDGLPDAWEKQKSLDPAKAADAAAFTLDKQYSNIEVYLNSLVK